MKKIYSLLLTALCSSLLWAQSPEKMSYQAVIRDADNALAAAQAVTMRVSLLQGSIAGSVMYQETHATTTNLNGLVSFEIGGGAVVSGDFAVIDWANGPYFIKTETDPSGGTNYTIYGTQQLLSVPFALHAKTADNGLTTAQSETITNNKVAIAELLGELTTLKERVAVLEDGSTPYNPGVSVQDNLDNGVPILDLLAHVTVDELYGKTYEGGLIFYVNEIDGTGLVAAPTDQATEDSSTGAKWGCWETQIDGADGIAIGTGAQNTLDILADCSETGTAAQLCADLVLNEKEDWFLPSKDELNAMYVNLKVNGLGGFGRDDVYWSSTETNNNYAAAQIFSNGFQGNNGGKNGTFNVRAVRAF